MPMAPLKACINCGKASAGDLCPDCREKSKQRRRAYDRKRAADDPIRKLYLSTTWTRLSASLKRCNPICQFIDANGVQCETPAYAVHHIISPKDAPALFYDWANLVAVCEHHHAGGQRGETQGANYADTIGLPVGGLQEPPRYPHRQQTPVTAASPAAPVAATLPVAPEHMDLPDGYKVIKRETGAQYVKQGSIWALILD